VLPLPAELDREVARLKLSAMGIAIDSLTESQRAYLGLP
jgi:adenosylhomocysteinase